jgi:hypothetical protein
MFLGPADQSGTRCEEIAGIDENCYAIHSLLRSSPEVSEGSRGSPHRRPANTAERKAEGRQRDEG